MKKKWFLGNAAISRTDAMNSIAEYSQAVRDAQYQLENYSMPLILQGMDAITAADTMKAQLDAALAAFEPYKYYPASDPKRYDLLVWRTRISQRYHSCPGGSWRSQCRPVEAQARGNLSILPRPEI
jgi:hypothetical protein